MSGDITARELALANFIVCESLNREAAIIKYSSLHLISRQLAQLKSKKTTAYCAAFVAYWINKWRPFVSANEETAAIVAIALAQCKPTSVELLKKAIASKVTITDLEKKLSCD